MTLRKDGSGGAELENFPKVDEVVGNRNGDVLIKNTLLKADHFPGCQNTKLVPLLDGAPNFRQVDGLPVYGVAIPTVRGLRNVLDAVGAFKGQRKVFWHNLREEPVLYINGKPYVVREADQPFCNVEYTGIDRSRVEDMEVRLKRDVLREAQQYDGHILVTEEDDDMQVIEAWEHVTEADVQTPLEAYAELSQDGYDVDYLRVPITDEKAPKNTDFELLIQRLWSVPEGSALVFNCQMGRGRTTTGTIIATLLQLRKMQAFPVTANGGSSNPQVPEWFAKSGAALAAAGAYQPVVPRDKLKAGMYGVVRSLLRVLERGLLGKAILDTVIDANQQMQNLREAIASYRSRLLNEEKERKRATLMAVCLEYLERYYMLLCFASYITWPKFSPTSAEHVTFQDWTDSRPELRSVLSRMLRRNPMSALELHVPAATLPPGTPQQLDSEADQQILSQAEAQADRIMESRAGAVLGPFTILKEDYFPGMKSNKLPQTLAGASNFRGMKGNHVYGVAMSTLAGIKNVLREVKRQQGDQQDKTILWFNMREEPVVYVNGRPFVLREQQRPMKNLQEYAGIDASRLERMEQRLKEDVLTEAERYGGRILVARESAISGGGRGELIDTWEWVSTATAVQTPAEVYEMLRKDGFNVKYARIPVTDGMAPQPADFDEILTHVREVGLDSPLVFNCQLGAGRTTTGTVIGGLLHMYADQQVLSKSSSATRLAEMPLDVLQDELQGGSPKSEDDEQDGHMLNGINLFDLTPLEVEEQKALAAGGYVGVRRVVRILEDGDAVKRAVDAAIDSNGQLINLRMSIMKYRRPRNSYKNHKSETSARHISFSRGSAYLERYCMLIALGGYLAQVGCLSSTSFSAWLGGRPDLQQALATIHTNPATALAAVPVAPVAVVYRPANADQVVTPEEQQQVLSKRRGRTLNRRIILKSYVSRALDPTAPPNAPDLRQAAHLPIFTIGNTSCAGLRKLLSHLGAGPGGNVHVVITDVREELVVYVNGVPYMRREVEMPAAALHHAGVQARQLEGLEVALREDVVNEALRWGGRILLHQEVPNEGSKRSSAVGASGSGRGSLVSPLPGVLTDSFLTPPNAPSSPFHLHTLFAPSPVAVAPSNLAQKQQQSQELVVNGVQVGSSPASGGDKGASQQQQQGTPLADNGTSRLGSQVPLPPRYPSPSPFIAPSAAAAAAGAEDKVEAVEAGRSVAATSAAAAAASLEGFPGFCMGHFGSSQSQQQQAQQVLGRSDRDDVTGPSDARPGSAVAPFWEAVDVSAAAAGDAGTVSWKRLASCLEVAKHLQAEGYQISYRRIPLSRERTPVANDLDALHKQMLLQERIKAAADGKVTEQGQELSHQSSLTAGTAVVEAVPPAAGGESVKVIHLVLSRTATGSSARFAAAALATYLLDPTAREQGAAVKGGSPSSSEDGSGRSPKRLKRTMSDLGEYRGIMSVSRLLPGGMEVKAAVDMAIDQCSSIGNLRADIKACKHLAEAFPPSRSEDPDSTAWAARQLGVHYLKRYFLLLAFRCYLVQRQRQESLGQAPVNFSKWMDDRRELGHLLNHLNLDT